jgi:aspartate aminotransferase
MPTSSKRGNDLTQSPIRSLIPFSREAKRLGRKVLHLNIGQPDIETPWQALQAIKNDRKTIISYGPSEGLPSLREKVANYYSKFSGPISSENLFVTTGASEAIRFVFQSCLDEHDEIIIPEPFYANYIGFASSCSVNIVPITTTFETQFHLPDIEAFKALITPRTKAIFLCNPGNPTGQLYKKENLQKLLHFAIENNLFLIVDEVYREFCYDAQFTSALSFPEGKNNVVVIDSISKVFSSCGARVGFLVTRNEKVLQTALKYAELRLCPPYLGQILAEACFDHGMEYVKKAKVEYQKRRKVLYEGLQQIDGLDCYLPGAAFYNVVQFPFQNVTNFCKWMLSDFELENETVMLAPANGFYFNQSLGNSQARIAYILNSEKLARALHILGEAVSVYQQNVVQEIEAVHRT